jgi:hypothetical protein
LRRMSSQVRRQMLLEDTALQGTSPLCAASCNLLRAPLVNALSPPHSCCPLQADPLTTAAVPLQQSPPLPLTAVLPWCQLAVRLSAAGWPPVVLCAVCGCCVSNLLSFLQQCSTLQQAANLISRDFAHFARRADSAALNCCCCLLMTSIYQFAQTGVQTNAFAELVVVAALPPHS